MADNGKRGQTLGKAALARANRIEDGDITTTDPRVSPMAQSLGITFDGNNNVNGNQTNVDIAALQATVTAQGLAITVLENRLADYETHTHTYQDATINDTADGTGVSTDTQRTTDGVS